MELTSFLGVVLGIVAVVGAMVFKHIHFAVLLNIPAIFVIFIGTIATVLNSYPGTTLKSIGALFRILFTKQKGISAEEVIDLMFDLSKTARAEGLLSLEAKAHEIGDPFFRKGLRLLADGTHEEVIADILEGEIYAMEKRHETNAGIFSSAGMYAPTLGVLGAVFGLIAAMASIDDTDKMATAIAAAFIATIFGIFTGYVLWNPFAKKLRVKSQQEVAVKEMIVKGILSIAKGDPPSVIKEKLMSMLPEAAQRKISSK